MLEVGNDIEDNEQDNMNDFNQDFGAPQFNPQQVLSGREMEAEDDAAEIVNNKFRTSKEGGLDLSDDEDIIDMGA